MQVIPRTLGEPPLHGRGLVRAGVVEHQVNVDGGWHRGMVFRKRRNSTARWRGSQRAITFPLATLSAAKSEVVPCRLPTALRSTPTAAATSTLVAPLALARMILARSARASAVFGRRLQAVSCAISASVNTTGCNVGPEP